MAITLTEMTELANALVAAESAAAEAENIFKLKKETARILREETVPAAMQELGLQDLTLATGQKLSVKQDVYASIPPESKHAAMEWLNQHGFAGLIKVGVQTDFGKGESARAYELFTELQRRGLPVQYGENVHPQTLKAFLREQIAKGADVPLDLFGARPVWTTKITQK